MKIFTLLFFVSFISPCADSPSYIQKNHSEYVSIAPSPGTIVPRLPPGFGFHSFEGKRYYSFAGVYYVPDSVFGQRVYLVVDCPYPLKEETKSKLDNPRTLHFNGMICFIEISIDNEASFFKNDGDESNSSYSRIHPPAGTFIETLPPGTRSVIITDVQYYNNAEVFYINAKIHGKRVFVVVDSPR